jgi:hypothetical protein
LGEEGAAVHVSVEFGFSTDRRQEVGSAETRLRNVSESVFHAALDLTFVGGTCRDPSGDIEESRGFSIQMESLKPSGLRTSEVTLEIISDVDAVVRLALGDLGGCREKNRMGFGCADLAGNDDFIKIGRHLVVSQNRMQSAIKIGENEESKVRAEEFERWHDIGKNLPGLGFSKGGVEILKEGLKSPFGQGIAEGHLEAPTDELLPPSLIVIRRGSSLVLGGWKALPSRPKG